MVRSQGTWSSLVGLFEEMTAETCQAKPDEIKRLVKRLSLEVDKLLEIKE